MTANPAFWRLSTDSGIKYKIISMDGTVGYQKATATVRAIIRSVDLQDFVTTLMPNPVAFGNLKLWRAQSFPGFPSLVVDNVFFKALDDNQRPIDPFLFDTGAIGSDTYDPYLEVTIFYTTDTKKRDPNPNRPETFLEISASTSFEVLNVYAGRSKWLIESNPKIDEGGNAADGEDSTWVNPSTGELFGVYKDPDTGHKVRGPITQPANAADQKKTNKQGASTPISIVVPITNWQVRWPDVDHDFFEDIMIHRLRAAGGKVNRKLVTFLYDGAIETMLFTGWSYLEKNSWRELSGNSNKPPIELTMNFSEKRILWNGLIKGWNDYWSNDEGGWRKMLFNGTDKPYQKWDLNLLFTMN